MSSFLSTSRAVATVKCIPTVNLSEKIVHITNRPKNVLLTVPKYSISKGFGTSLCLFNGTSVTCGINVPLQVRFSHADVAKVPDFSSYRLKSTKDPKVKSADSEVQRKVFTYTTAFAGAIIATTTAKFAVKTLIEPLGPSAKTLALASTEVNLSSIPEGKNLVVKWRNKPLFVRHRTDAEIERERAVPLSELRHQETDDERVKDPKWLVCLGVCTHLGCVPIANAGDFHGYYCPCHGSHYDSSGRIRKGPAPLNLEVPDYTFVDENTLLVG